MRPHATTRDHPPLDVLVVPGARDTWRERTNGRMLDWMEGRYSRTGPTISAWTSAFLFAERGLPDGRRATARWASVELMRERTRWSKRAWTRVVDEGRIVTSAGIDAAST